jgi:hypothetical protein
MRAFCILKAAGYLNLAVSWLWSKKMGPKTLIGINYANLEKIHIAGGGDKARPEHFT